MSANTAVTHLLLRRQCAHLTGMCGADPFGLFLRAHALEQVPPSLRTVCNLQQCADDIGTNTKHLLGGLIGVFEVDVDDTQQ